MNRRRPTRNSDGRPLALVCYLCGREFGLSSLSIHIPQCAKKWGAYRSQLPIEIARRMKPNKGPLLPIPDAYSTNILDELQRYNEEAQRIFSECTRVRCGCGRNFDPDRLVVHMRSCDKANSGSDDSSAGMRRVHSRPRMHLCYICGREYGSASLPIHQKKCLEKRAIEQSRLPKHLRTPAPKPPMQTQSTSGGSVGNNSQQIDQVDAMNAAAYDAWKASLSPCPHCGRTFVPESLKVHLRSCKR